jgi:hypothetical protein
MILLLQAILTSVSTCCRSFGDGDSGCGDSVEIAVFAPLFPLPQSTIRSY